MSYKVTISMIINVDDYLDLEDSEEDVTKITQEMIRGEADWPNDIYINVEQN